MPWCIEAELGLHKAFWGMSAKRSADKVLAGEAQLWRIDGDTWVMTQVYALNSLLWIWCIEGKNAVAVVSAFARIARLNGLTAIGFFTHHKAARYGFRKFSPVIHATSLPGEMHFCMKTEDFDYGDHEQSSRGSEQRDSDGARSAERESRASEQPSSTGTIPRSIVRDECDTGEQHTEHRPAAVGSDLAEVTRILH